MTSSIAERIAEIRAQIPDTVRLVAVTKTVSVEAMRAAYAAGVRDFGENRIQEAMEKQEQLQDLPDITWHLIGHVQSNKAIKAVQHFQWIHSVDSLKLAKRLDKLAQESECKPLVCLQVKILPDPNKYGWTVSELLDDLGELNQCQQISIKGLMTIPPLGLNHSETLSVFEQTRELADQIHQQGWSNLEMKELSMGMSGDYTLAVQAGATLIRPGQIIFGARTT
ncbi:MAG: YggS family pyridoxal phosphate-dependent enzyme [Cyanobacteria bacterium J06592_8]